MKRSDLSPRMRKTLVALPDYPGAFAIVPPPAPAMVPIAGIEGDLFAAHEALSHLNAMTAGLLNPNVVARTLDRREAVRSSQIEGTVSEVDQLLEYEATGSAEGLPPDVHATLNYVKALDHGMGVVQKKGAAGFDLKLIRKIHAILMEGDSQYRDTPGRLRSRQNWIGGRNIYEAKLVPPPPGEMSGPLDDLVNALRYSASQADQYSVSVIVRMAITHAYFEMIHPFLDGNGRVGRILLPLMLVAEGYPAAYMAGFMKTHQTEYYRLLGAAQLREQWPEWVRFIAKALRAACRDATDVARDLAAIREKWQRQLEGVRRDSSALTALDYLLSNPVITVNKLKAHLGVSFPAANNAVQILLQREVLSDHPARYRERVFVAKDVVARLERA